MVSTFMDGYSPLMRSLIMAESSGNPNAVSPKGAFGLAQLMPDTARDPGYGVPPLRDDSPEENVRLGNDYLMAMLKKYNGNQRLALAAYNSGPSSVDNALRKAGGNESAALEFLPQETQKYVPKVMGDNSNLSIMPIAASIQKEELPAGQAAEAQSKDALSQLIAMQQKRLAGDPERDRRMMWMNFFANMTGNHANLSDAIAAGAGSIPKTLAEQDAVNDKRMDSSLASQIEIEKFKRGEALKQQELANSTKQADAYANYYNSRGDALEGIKPLPVGALKLQDEITQSLAINKNLVTQAEAQAKLIREGKVPLEPTGKIEAWGRNMLGMSDADSLAYDRYQTFKTKLANDTLLLAKGTQTEGDAQRAVDALITPSNDPEVAANAMEEVARINKELIGMQKQRQKLINKNYGIADEEVSEPSQPEPSAAPKVIKYDATGKRVQ